MPEFTQHAGAVPRKCHGHLMIHIPITHSFPNPVGVGFCPNLSTETSKTFLWPVDSYIPSFFSVSIIVKVSAILNFCVFYLSFWERFVLMSPDLRHPLCSLSRPWAFWEQKVLVYTSISASLHLTNHCPSLFLMLGLSQFLGR